MDDAVGGTTELRFVVAVRNLDHVEAVPRNLRRLSMVIQADRVFQPRA